MVLNVVNEPILVVAHFKKVIFLLAYHRRAVVLGAVAVVQFSFGIESLAANAIQATIRTEVNLPRIVYLLKDRAHYPFVEFIGGTDKIIVADLQVWPGFAKQFANLISIRLGILARCSCCFHDFVTMFISAGDKIGFLPGEHMESVQYICDDGCIGVAKMGWSIHVVYWRGDVVPISHRSSLS